MENAQNLSLEESIRVLLQNQVEELYYRVDGISENNIELLVTQLENLVINKQIDILKTIRTSHDETFARCQLDKKIEELENKLK